MLHLFQIFKMWNKELYVREQQDAYEFFTSLVDQLDEHLKVNHTHHSNLKIQYVQQLSSYIRKLVMMIKFLKKFLSTRKWVENRSSKTHFRESSLTRRFVKTVLTGEQEFFLSYLLFHDETYHNWSLTSHCAGMSVKKHSWHWTLEWLLVKVWRSH